MPVVSETKTREGLSRRAVVAAAGVAGLIAAAPGLAQAQNPSPTFRAGPPWSAPRAGARLDLSLGLRTPEGPTTLEDQMQGRPAVINLWATWCPPCRAEKPALNRLARQEAARGGRIAVLSVLAFDEEVTEPGQLVGAYRRFNAPALTPLRATSAAEQAFVGYFGAGSQRSRTALPVTALVAPDGADLGRVIGAAVLGASGRSYWADPSAESMFDRLAAFVA